eukprot:scaffold6_cov330-Pavlova_lutheri.AAC.21
MDVAGRVPSSRLFGIVAPGAGRNPSWHTPSWTLLEGRIGRGSHAPPASQRRGGGSRAGSAGTQRPPDRGDGAGGGHCRADPPETVQAKEKQTAHRRGPFVERETRRACGRDGRTDGGWLTPRGRATNAGSGTAVRGMDAGTALSAAQSVAKRAPSARAVLVRDDPSAKRPGETRRKTKRC